MLYWHCVWGLSFAGTCVIAAQNSLYPFWCLGKTFILLIHEKDKSEDLSTQDEVLASNPGTEIIEEGAPSANNIEVTKEIKGVKETRKYVSKRITCDKCDKRFNKQETYIKHMKKFHVGAGETIKNISNSK